MDDAWQSWEKFLNPETLKRNLIAASVFITAYEFLRESLIEPLRGLYADHLTWHDVKSGKRLSDISTSGVPRDYREKVLSLHKREDMACATWFKNMGALDDSDLEALKVITDHRNVIAHELPTIIADAERDISLEHLLMIYLLVRKLDLWWIQEVEIPTDPDLDEASLAGADLDSSFSLRMLFLRLLINVAQGDDGDLKTLYENLKLKRLVG